VKEPLRSELDGVYIPRAGRITVNLTSLVLDTCPRLSGLIQRIQQKIQILRDASNGRAVQAFGRSESEPLATMIRWGDYPVLITSFE